MSTPDLIENLVSALPPGFDFYHLGRVELSHNDHESNEALAPLGIAFTIQGDVRGTLALLFDEDLDVSTYSELGNIIASQMATELSNKQGLDVLISPPKVLARTQIQTLLGAANVRSRTYLHRLQGRVIQLQTLLLTSEKTTHV